MNPATLLTVETVADVLDWYAANELRKYSAAALSEMQRQRGLFRATFGHLPIENCRPFHLLAFITSQKGVFSNWTRRRIKASINRPFNYAAEVGLIPYNPFRGLRLSQGKNGRDWTDEEYQAILRVSSAYFRRLVIFLRFGGGRPGEARELKWREVHCDLNAIIQSEHKSAWAQRGPRRIHFNHVLLKLLMWMARRRGSSERVFLNAFGRPWTIGALAKHLRMVRARVGIPKDVKMHGGRHTFATKAIENGVDLVTVAQLLGHAQIATTSRYVHLANKRQHLQAAANKAIGAPEMPLPVRTALPPSDIQPKATPPSANKTRKKRGCPGKVAVERRKREAIEAVLSQLMNRARSSNAEKTT